MKRVIFSATTMLMTALAGGTLAQERDNAFEGFKVGGTVGDDRHQIRSTPPGFSTRLDEREGGIGYRVFGGYDVAVADRWIVGAELAVGSGGKAIEATAGVADYRFKPGLTYDVSARAGFLATPTVLVYGRGGYRWLKTDERTAFSTPGRAPVVRDGTEGGFLYGIGAEWAVSDEIALRAEFDQTNFGDGLKAAQLRLGVAWRF